MKLRVRTVTIVAVSIELLASQRWDHLYPMSLAPGSIYATTGNFIR